MITIGSIVGSGVIAGGFVGSGREISIDSSVGSTAMVLVGGGGSVGSGSLVVCAGEQAEIKAAAASNKMKKMKNFDCGLAVTDYSF